MTVRHWTANQKEELRKGFLAYVVDFNESDRFLPRNARSASAVLLSYVVRPSVCPSVRLSVTLMYRGRIGWTSSKLITEIISLGSSLLGATTSAT